MTNPSRTVLGVTKKNQISVTLRDSYPYRFRISAFAFNGSHVGTAYTDPSGYIQDSDIFDDAGYTYAGGWITASNPADLGGGVHFSTAAGATATYSDNRAFAWITTTGPTHGSARVYIDGVLVKTVSTYSAVVHRRRVVFARYWNVFFGPPHTITIMNIATSGHPRVDVDGVAIMSEG